MNVSRRSFLSRATAALAGVLAMVAAKWLPHKAKLRGPFPRLEFVDIEDQKPGLPRFALFWITGIGQAEVIDSWIECPTSDQMEKAVIKFSKSHREILA